MNTSGGKPMITTTLALLLKRKIKKRNVKGLRIREMDGDSKRQARKALASEHMNPLGQTPLSCTHGVKTGYCIYYFIISLHSATRNRNVEGEGGGWHFTIITSAY